VDGALTCIAPIRPLQLCADGGYQPSFRSLGVPLIMVPDSIRMSDECTTELAIKKVMTLLKTHMHGHF
jgi:hypothetical protein